MTAAGEVRLLQLDRPLLRIPQLAIHLDREVNEKGLVLNRQQHLAPLWALSGHGATEDGDATASFVDVVAKELGLAPDDVVAWDVMVHPVEPSRLVGLDEELVSAPRIDNQLSCWAATTALSAGPAGADGSAGGDRRARAPRSAPPRSSCCSTTRRSARRRSAGAAGGFLGSVLERVASACGLDRAAYLGALARSICVSADCAHATNPNYADRHEPGHTIALERRAW